MQIDKGCMSGKKLNTFEVSFWLFGASIHFIEMTTTKFFIRNYLEHTFKIIIFSTTLFSFCFFIFSIITWNFVSILHNWDWTFQNLLQIIYRVLSKNSIPICLHSTYQTREIRAAPAKLVVFPHPSSRRPSRPFAGPSEPEPGWRGHTFLLQIMIPSPPIDLCLIFCLFRT